MPESSKQVIRKSQKTLHTYSGELVPFGKHRSDKAPTNMIGHVQFFAQYFLQDLQTANDQEIIPAHKWLDENTNTLKQCSDISDIVELLEHKGYLTPDTVAEISKTTSAPMLIAGDFEETVPSGDALDVVFSASNILERLASPDTCSAERQQLVCEAEFCKFSQTEQETLLGILWQYILDHRNSEDSMELVAAGSAIRKFAALMPMDRMEDLAVLIEPGYNTPPAIEVELELAKMVYRNYEVYPPAEPDQQSQLTIQLWRLAQDYLNPRFLLREKHSAVASLAIEALIAMRSSVAEAAWRAALECPYQWFGEMVSDHVATLRSCWSGRNDSAVAWLDELRSRVIKANL